MILDSLIFRLSFTRGYKNAINYLSWDGEPFNHRTLTTLNVISNYWLPYEVVTSKPSEMKIVHSFETL